MIYAIYCKGEGWCLQHQAGIFDSNIIDPEPKRVETFPELWPALKALEKMARGLKFSTFHTKTKRSNFRRLGFVLYRRGKNRWVRVLTYTQTKADFE